MAPTDDRVLRDESRRAPPHVVIIGGGFGGLNAAQALAGADVRITLVDRRNHHLFQPLLYQVATAALNPSDIADADPPHPPQAEERRGIARRGAVDRSREEERRARPTASSTTTT